MENIFRLYVGYPIHTPPHLSFLIEVDIVDVLTELLKKYRKEISFTLIMC